MHREITVDTDRVKTNISSRRRAANEKLNDPPGKTENEMSELLKFGIASARSSPSPASPTFHLDSLSQPRTFSSFSLCLAVGAVPASASRANGNPGIKAANYSLANNERLNR